MPEWAKSGPVNGRNYSYRAESHCALKSSGRNGEHPTIKLESPEFLAWHQYFDQHIGQRPRIFQMLLDKTIREMTVPEPVPQWFDPSFTPNPSWRPNAGAQHERGPL
jgi:hypothetical protein